MNYRILQVGCGDIFMNEMMICLLELHRISFSWIFLRLLFFQGCWLERRKYLKYLKEMIAPSYPNFSWQGSVCQSALSWIISNRLRASVGHFLIGGNDCLNSFLNGTLMGGSIFNAAVVFSEHLTFSKKTFYGTNIFLFCFCWVNVGYGSQYVGYT